MGGWRFAPYAAPAGADRAAEIKRMFVADEARGRGLVALLLTALEDDARAAGADWMVLETGRAPGGGRRALPRQRLRRHRAVRLLRRRTRGGQPRQAVTTVASGLGWAQHGEQQEDRVPGRRRGHRAGRADRAVGRRDRRRLPARPGQPRERHGPAVRAPGQGRHPAGRPDRGRRQRSTTSTRWCCPAAWPTPTPCGWTPTRWRSSGTSSSPASRWRPSATRRGRWSRPTSSAVAG